MIPFRPTIERVWEAIHSVRADYRSERGYTVLMGPALWRDLLVDHRFRWNLALDPNRMTIFGLPVEIDYSLNRGWISVRHEVVA
jgi:hypothetical protein